MQPNSSHRPGRTIPYDVASDLIAHLYDAATSPGGWTPALHELARCFGTADAVIVATDRTTATVEQHTSGPIDEFIDAYARGPAFDRSIWRLDAPLDEPLDDGWFFPQGDFLASTLYRDFLCALPARRFALVYSRVAAERHTYLALVRPDARDEFDAGQKSALRLLGPHVRRAFATFAQLRTANERAALTISALERLPLGTIVIGATGGVVHANAAARAAMTRGGLVLRGADRGVGAKRRRDEVRLQALIAAALGGRRTAAGATMTIDTEWGRPLVVTLVPLRSGETGFPAGGALMLLAPPPLPNAAEPAFLRDVFKLTDAEARLASAFASEPDLAAVAARLAISKETARTHLKRIFVKTGTSRQSELLLLLQRYAAVDPAAFDNGSSP